MQKIYRRVPATSRAIGANCRHRRKSFTARGYGASQEVQVRTSDITSKLVLTGEPAD